jgi:hypothetical protein
VVPFSAAGTADLLARLVADIELLGSRPVALFANKDQPFRTLSDL